MRKTGIRIQFSYFGAAINKICKNLTVPYNKLVFFWKMHFNDFFTLINDLSVLF